MRQARAGSGSIVLLWPARRVSARAAWPRSSPRPRRCRPPRGAGTRRADPYGPFIAALRSHLRADPEGLEMRRRSRPIWPTFCPRSVQPAADSDRATIFEAVRCALVTVSPRRPGAAAPRRPPVVRRVDARAAGGARLAPQRTAASDDRRLPVRRPSPRPHAAPAAQRAAPRRRLEELALGRSAARTPRSFSRALLPEQPSPSLCARDPRPHGRLAVLHRGAGLGADRQGRTRSGSAAASSWPPTATSRSPRRSATRS